MTRGRSSRSSIQRVSTGTPASRMSSAPASRSAMICCSCSSRPTPPCSSSPTWQCASTSPGTTNTPTPTVCASGTGSLLINPEESTHRSRSTSSGNTPPRTYSGVVTRSAGVGRREEVLQLLGQLEVLGQIESLAGLAGGLRSEFLSALGRVARPALAALLVGLGRHLALGLLAAATHPWDARHAGHPATVCELAHHLLGLDEALDQAVDVGDRRARAAGDAL